MVGFKTHLLAFAERAETTRAKREQRETTRERECRESKDLNQRRTREQIDTESESQRERELGLIFVILVNY